MSEHRDTTISVTVGSQVAGLQVNEALVDAIWGPTATMDAIATAMRDYLRNTLILAHNINNGVPMSVSEQYVDQNTGRTE